MAVHAKNICSNVPAVQPLRGACLSKVEGFKSLNSRVTKGDWGSLDLEAHAQFHQTETTGRRSHVDYEVRPTIIPNVRIQDWTKTSSNAATNYFGEFNLKRRRDFGDTAERLSVHSNYCKKIFWNSFFLISSASLVK